MAMPQQKTAARRNIKKARAVKSETFAFPKQRKEPLNDAGHVRNAIARFDQVKGVSVAERDAAWRRIRAAARKFGVEIKARGWRQLMRGGVTGRPKARRTPSRGSRR